jgi:hypothetical protein
VLGAAKPAIDAPEEDRRGIEAVAIRNDAGRDIASGVRTFDHHGAHEQLPDSFCCTLSVALACDDHLTRARRDRDRSPAFPINAISRCWDVLFYFYRAN